MLVPSNIFFVAIVEVPGIWVLAELEFVKDPPPLEALKVVDMNVVVLEQEDVVAHEAAWVAIVLVDFGEKRM